MDVLVLERSNVAQGVSKSLNVGLIVSTKRFIRYMTPCPQSHDECGLAICPQLHETATVKIPCFCAFQAHEDFATSHVALMCGSADHNQPRTHPVARRSAGRATSGRNAAAHTARMQPNSKGCKWRLCYALYSPWRLCRNHEVPPRKWRQHVRQGLFWFDCNDGIANGGSMADKDNDDLRKLLVEAPLMP